MPARCLVGRSRACDLMLAEPAVSSQHAVAEWTGSLWQLKDLGSRNGTFVDARRLAANELMPLQEGACIRFGRATNEWVLVDASPPRPMAVNIESGRIELEDSGLLVLPDAEHPELVLHMEGDGRWVSDVHGELATVGDRALLTVADELWRVHLSLAGSGTLDADDHRVRLADLRLCFAHSPNEEYIELTAEAGASRMDLEARAHNYVLLLLARARLADQARGVVPPDQGWIHQEKLLDMLKIEPAHLNITIHRARLHLARSGVSDATRLVERRKGTRQLRLGVARIEIVRL